MGTSATPARTHWISRANGFATNRAFALREFLREQGTATRQPACSLLPILRLYGAIRTCDAGFKCSSSSFPTDQSNPRVIKSK